MDPDVASDRLHSVGFHTGTAADSYWTMLIDDDPREIEKDRMLQKTYLARYGRISPFEWEHRDVCEMRAHFESLSRVISLEAPSAAPKREEDR